MNAISPLAAETACATRFDYAKEQTSATRQGGPNHPNGGAISAERWYLTETLPRQETVAERELAEAGFITYRPMVLERRRAIPSKRLSVKNRMHDNFRVVRVSAFPGYLFVWLNLHTDPWREVRHTVGIKSVFLGSGGRPEPVERGAVEALKSGEVERLKLRSVYGEIMPHAGIEVIEGPYAGHRGICVSCTDTAAVVTLIVFGRPIPVPMDRGWVKAV